MIFIHVDDLKICPTPADAGWTPGPSTAKSLCASTVAFRPGTIVSNSDSTPSVIVSTCNNASHTSTRSNSRCNLDDPIDLTDHILSPLFVFSLCRVAWTPSVCYQCSEVDQIPHRFPNKSCLSDMAVKISSLTHTYN